ncbi:hypothetical protein [Aerosakkonema funiforme]|uniref:Uncharacterized protein n=1 Tax=Aerosakkonema funiforme FACHB-1375 TaxID=2949571 RepID=A0A926VFR6_9CYAN|nr:hypothetical protein [Aerosakkonema funiforme]MBD2182448.1 hypothetical protein [Aerosakkonema funiforme FACHB-1375]
MSKARGFHARFSVMLGAKQLDTIIIIAITTVAVGGVKLGYAFMADRARLLISSQIKKGTNIAAGFVMIAVGVLLITKS